MARIEPLRGLRYNLERVDDLGAVTAPPYDVIGPDLQRELLAIDHNIVHIDLNAAPADAGVADNRYEQAAATLQRWLDEGVLQRDDQPAIYAYEQHYDWAGERLSRRGFIAAVRLEPLGEGSIHPHERTFSGPKEDRFQLTVATRCNLSQGLAIYDDPEGAVSGVLAEVYDREPDMAAIGRDGVSNRLWVITDGALVKRVCAAMADRDLFIADGHHRYGMALRYLDWLAEREDVPDDHPARYTAQVLVGSDDAGLRVMPTHRVVSGLTGFSVARLRDEAGRRFDWQEVDVDPSDAGALESFVAALPLSSLGVLTSTGVGVLTPREGALSGGELEGLSETLASLNVSVLHRLLWPAVLEPVFGAGETAYVHRVDEAQAGLAAGADVAFLLRATPLETVFEVAGNGELMPQKSTYFYPKVLTGLVSHPLWK